MTFCGEKARGVRVGVGYGDIMKSIERFIVVEGNFVSLIGEEVLDS
jgi:hypothetical protein